MIGSFAKRGVGADLRRGLVAVHLGHLRCPSAPRRRAPGRAPRQSLTASRPLLATVDLRAHALEQLDRDLLVDLVVLGQQDPHAVQPAAVLSAAARWRRPSSALAGANSVTSVSTSIDLRDRLDQEAVDARAFSASSRTSSRPNAVTMTTPGLLLRAAVLLDPARGLEPSMPGIFQSMKTTS